jgi:hypothetical protein
MCHIRVYPSVFWYMRKSLLVPLSALYAASLVLPAFARDYDLSHLPYPDAPSDRPTAIAISTLTEAGVLQGDPNGTIRPNAELNRAEFIKIVMSLMPTDDWTAYNTGCFPDVAAGAWYAPFVCRAKAMGIVTGHARPSVPESQWMFKPNSAVQYEEAVKVLAGMYALSLDSRGGVWYEPYLRAAQASDLAIGGLRPGDHIKRGEMARLVTGFLAFNEGELENLRAAEEGTVMSSSSSSSTSSGTGSSMSSRASSVSTSSKSSSVSNKSSSSKSGSSVSSSSSVGSWKGGYDTESDTAIRARVVTLGKTSPIMGAVNLFSNNEPLQVDGLRITLAGSTPTLDSFLVYDEDKRYLGRATLDTSVAGEKQYLLKLGKGVLTLPKRENVLVYVRASVKSHEQGGESNQNIRIASFGIEGNGEWTSDEYNQTYSDTFPTFLTARSRIVKVENVGAERDNFVAATNRRLASFRFTGEGDSEGLNNLRVTSLAFQIDAPSGVTLSNVYLRREGGDETSNCTVSSGVATCSSIPSSIGTVKGESTIHVYADVSDGGVTNPTLRLTINSSGTSTSAGSVMWTDGEATFTWLGLDSPVARGTQFD